MALTTYAELLTAIQRYEDDTSSIVTDVQADMVTLAEQRMFLGSGRPGGPMYSPALRCRAMERTVVLPIAPGEAGGTSGGSANAHTVTLTTVPTLARGLVITFVAGFTNTGATTLDPNSLGATAVRKGKSFDALEAGDILVGGTYTVYYDGTYFVLMPADGCCPVPTRFLGIKGAYLQDRGKILSQMPDTGMNLFMDGATADEPDYWAIVGDAIRFSPLPDDTYYLSLNYYARPAALSTSLNDIFRDAPGIYLYASLLELAIYLGNDTMAEKMLPNYMGACAAYARSDMTSSQGFAPMRVRMGIAP